MAKLKYNQFGNIIFTKEMKKEYTILAPQMIPIHFEMIIELFRAYGFKADVLKTSNYELIHEGLKYVHNDTCIPALLVIGQMIDAIKNGGYNKRKIALVITQTGGGCRASNYIHLLRQALKKADLEYIPVISLNPGGLEKNPGFKLPISMIRKAFNALTYGDLIMQLSNEVKPYEIEKGATLRLQEKWLKELSRDMHTKDSKKWKVVKSKIARIVSDYHKIPVDRSKKIPRVGVVGEIYVKYSPLGNNNLEALLEKEGCEIVVPPIIDFFIFKMDYRIHEIELYGGKNFLKNFIKKSLISRIIKNIERRKAIIRTNMVNTPFNPPAPFENLLKLVDGYVGRGNRMGEGWLLTAEMLELIHIDAPNIVCTQPFGCLPNHISGKGMFKKIKKNHPEANIVPIDYDASASEINQVNRIKLMVTNAYRNLSQQ